MEVGVVAVWRGVYVVEGWFRVEVLGCGGGW